MTQEEFDDIRAELAAEAYRIANAKRAGYTQNNIDVLHNFKTAGTNAGTTALQAWSVYFWKHVAAILTYAKDPEVPQAEAILGRVADARNYLDLFMGLVTEHAERKQGGR